ncbi:MAG TPA: ankyrin repeat domain-containing protein [Gaiella sp.]|nr:ankyrin repeat domain-containing protein [Gaiella sp.]
MPQPPRTARVATAQTRGVRARRLHPLVAVVPVGALLLAACSADGTREPPRPAAVIDAARAGDEDEVRRLVDAGADPDAADELGRTAVTHAAYAGHAAVVRTLVTAGADIDLQDTTRTNALLSTGETGFVDVLEEVLRAEPDLTRTNRFGGTALIPAADRGHVAVVRRLLETEIDVDHVNDLGWTALLEAVILGDGGLKHTEIVRLLVEAGADVSITDREGVTPLQHARSAGYDEIVAVLASAT